MGWKFTVVCMLKLGIKDNLKNYITLMVCSYFYIYSRVPLKRCPIEHNIWNISALTGAKYKWESEVTKYTPYIALKGELWGVFVWRLLKN